MNKASAFIVFLFRATDLHRPLWFCSETTIYLQAQTFICSVQAVGKLLKLFVSQFAHLKSGDYNSIFVKTLY